MVALGMNDLKNGTVIMYKNEPHVVTSTTHGGTGRGSGNVKAALKGLISGNSYTITFGPSDKLEEADVMKKSCQFLYESAGEYTFMDEETYEQFSFTKDELWDTAGYVTDGTKCIALWHDDKPVSISVPATVTLKVVETTPGLKGDTATGGTKPATLETGKVVNVPLFLKEGENIVVNTQTGEYQSRA